MHLGSTPIGKRRSRSIVSAAINPIEELEMRRLLTVGVTQNAGGWSVITQSAAGQTIYVDNSPGTGSDSYNGLSPVFTGGNNGPVKTIAHGYSLMRDGHDDWLLLQRGDTWNESISSWTKHGPTANDPMVLSYYGSYDDIFGTTYYGPGPNSDGTLVAFPDDPTGLNLAPRPIVDSGLGDGIDFFGGAVKYRHCGTSILPKEHQRRLLLRRHKLDRRDRHSRQLTGNNFLVEDVMVDGYKDNVVVGNPGTPVE